jgi:GTP diphosphokinase / guanosine-3',5'-bis(diphosphate) 3'-diphosphatase
MKSMKAMEDMDKRFESLKKKTEKYLSQDGVVLIAKAYKVAKKAHLGQYRASKAPFIDHPLKVAIILADLRQDEVAIAASLLHDTVEDSTTTIDEIKKEFGSEVAYLVEGLTKLSEITFSSLEEEQAENFRKMFLAMSNDLRVIIVKLADRLHNMKTLKYTPRETQEIKAKETMEIYAPLANRLGIITLKWQLEDLAFQCLYPEEFEKIKNVVAGRREDRESYTQKFVEMVKNLLIKAELKSKVSGRPKHFYSIYKKKQQRNEAEALYDLIGVRIIVSTVKECYLVLGVIHDAFKPIEGRFKDYIAIPKQNRYQSLHTTVIGPKGRPVEVQMRTHDMDRIAEYGIAAHWQYKEEKGHKRKAVADFFWLKQLVDAQKEKTEAGAYLRDLKVDLFDDEIFVFTPKGDEHVLPIGATPVDFAYKIHTAVGHKCIGARVNNKLVAFRYKLKSGDIVEILMGKKEDPKIDWLTFLFTPDAKSKVMQWFRKQNQEKNIEKGKEELDHKLKLSGFMPREILSSEKMKAVFKKYNVKNIDEFSLGISYGEISVDGVIKTLEQEKSDHKDVILPELLQTRKKEFNSGIRVLGESGIEVYMARCCNAIPGDPIVGYITMRRGISIHRKECSNMLSLDDTNANRLVEAEWEEPEREVVCPVSITIEVFERQGLFKEVINKIAETKTNILSLETIVEGATAKLIFSLQVKNVSHLNKVKANIKTIPDVYEVYRTA